MIYGREIVSSTYRPAAGGNRRKNARYNENDIAERRDLSMKRMILSFKNSGLLACHYPGVARGV
jgi:hypothetical protein